MPKLSEVATFNRKSLLSSTLNDVPDIRELHYPGNNYVIASRAVWTAMRSAAARQDDNALCGDGNRDGHVLTGIDIRQTIELLWPELDRNSVKRASVAIRKYLAAGNNVRCIRPGRAETQLTKLSEWWVADDWNSDISSLVNTQRLATQRSQRHIKGDHSTCLPNRSCRQRYDREKANNDKVDAIAATLAATPAAESPTVPVQPMPTRPKPTPPTIPRPTTKKKVTITMSDTTVSDDAASDDTEETPATALARTMNGHGRDDPFTMALIDFCLAAMNARQQWETESRDLRRKLAAVRSAFAAIEDVTAT